MQAKFPLLENDVVTELLLNSVLNGFMYKTSVTEKKRILPSLK